MIMLLSLANAPEQVPQCFDFARQKLEKKLQADQTLALAVTESVAVGTFFRFSSFFTSTTGGYAKSDGLAFD